MTITVAYSCPACGIRKQWVTVPARGDEDVVAWMDRVILVLAYDHARRSPGCHPKQLHDILIPIEGADRVGGPVLN